MYVFLEKTWQILYVCVCVCVYVCVCVCMRLRVCVYNISPSDILTILHLQARLRQNWNAPLQALMG